MRRLLLVGIGLAAGLLAQVRDTAPVRGPAPVERHPRGLLVPPDLAERVRAVNARPEVARLRARIDTLGEAVIPAKYAVPKLPPVKNQGQFGTCWSFASIGVVESKLLETGKTADLSEQYVIDHNPDGYGCNGGWVAFEFLRTTGTVTETACPYRGCATADANPAPAYKLTGWGFVGDQTAPPPDATLKAAVLAHGPLCCAVSAGPDWDAYQAGQVLAGGGPINHEVILCGWDDGRQAWLVRNSWGADWGDGGYCWVRYGAAGIGTGAAFASVEQPPQPPAPRPAPAPAPTPQPVPPPAPAPTPGPAVVKVVVPKWERFGPSWLGLVEADLTGGKTLLILTPPPAQ